MGQKRETTRKVSRDAAVFCPDNPEKTGRHGYGIEIDPHYVDTVIRRFEAVFGIKAKLAGSNLDFAAVSKLRSKEKHDGKKYEPQGIEEDQRRRKKGRKSA